MENYQSNISLQLKCLQQFMARAFLSLYYFFNFIMNSSMSTWHLCFRTCRSPIIMPLRKLFFYFFEDEQNLSKDCTFDRGLCSGEMVLTVLGYFLSLNCLWVMAGLLLMGTLFYLKAEVVCDLMVLVKLSLMTLLVGLCSLLQQSTDWKRLRGCRELFFLAKSRIFYCSLLPTLISSYIQKCQPWGISSLDLNITLWISCLGWDEVVALSSVCLVLGLYLAVSLSSTNQCYSGGRGFWAFQEVYILRILPMFSVLVLSSCIINKITGYGITFSFFGVNRLSMDHHFDLNRIFQFY